MMKNFLFPFFFLCAAIISCNADSKKETPSKEFVFDSSDAKRDELLQTYSKMPETSDIISAGDTGMAVYRLCQERYSAKLAQLKQQADSLNAKFIITILTPEVGGSVTFSTQKGIPFINEAAKKLGISCYDFSTPLSKYTPEQFTQMPIDGHWSAAGAKIISEMYKPLMEGTKNFRSSKNFSDKERPAIFGDQLPNQDEALDGGKELPYRLVTNSQGFRMNYNLTFPKVKQRILFLGDSQVYSPFLDNEEITTSLLQQHFPEKEIINAGVIGYTLDDQVELMEQRAKYIEPDIIILVTNPNDIGDFYFTMRNLLSRSKKAHTPSSIELDLYKKMFK